MKAYQLKRTSKQTKKKPLRIQVVWRDNNFTLHCFTSDDEQHATHNKTHTILPVCNDNDWNENHSLIKLRVLRLDAVSILTNDAIYIFMTQ